MVRKKFLLLLLVFFLFWSCATYQAPPPSLYIENLPPVIVVELSLDERIIAEEAWKNLRIGNGKKAREILSKLGDKNPFYYVGLGYVSYILQDLQAAEGYFRASLADHPRLILSHLGLAQIYEEAGEGDLAFIEYREILKIDPEHPWARPRYDSLQKTQTDAQLNSARTYMAEANTEAGKESYLKALYYSPKNTEAHLALAEMYSNEDSYENALVHLEAAYAMDPQNTDLLRIYGNTLFQLEDNKRSLEIYEELLAIDPDNEDVRSRIEIIKNRLGIFELPSQYDSIQFSEAITKEEISALIGVKFKDYLQKPNQKPPIIIDIATSWASKFIIQMASLGIIDVYPNHAFQPKKVITRAEMAETLNRVISNLKRKGYKLIQQIPPETIQISDVSPDNFYYRPIVLILSYDFMSLSPGKKFHPDMAVSGTEAIRVLDIILAVIA